MTTMIRWSPKLHFHHHISDLFPAAFDHAIDAPAERAASWLPAAEGRLEDGTYIIQLALPARARNR